MRREKEIDRMQTQLLIKSSVGRTAAQPHA
jgi:hypothetical protein